MAAVISYGPSIVPGFSAMMGGRIAEKVTSDECQVASRKAVFSSQYSGVSIQKQHTGA
jgi:hypothetical protein